MTTRTTETIGQRILRLAERQPDLPRERKALAERFGVTYETLRKWVNGSTAPTRKHIDKLVVLLHTTASEITHGIQPEGPAGIPAGASVALSLAVLSAAIAAVPDDARAEIGDLLRHWAAHGGKDLYRRAVTDLLLAATPGYTDTPISAAALHIARIYDSLDAGGQAALLGAATHVQNAADNLAPQALHAELPEVAADDPPPEPPPLPSPTPTRKRLRRVR